MSIVVQCPHCETKFNLQSDLAGKSMRCPNFDCQQVFTVKASARPTEPPPPSAARPKAPASAPKVPRSAPPPPAPAKPKAPDSAVQPERPAKPRPTSKPAPPPSTPKIKEVVWTEDADVPPPPPKTKKPARPVVEEPEEPDNAPIRRRKKKKERGPIILIGMLVLVVVVLGFIGLRVLKFQGDSEAELAKQAEAEYKKPDYSAANKSYLKLVEDYPDSNDAGKYKFFADLSGLQVVVRPATNRDNPEPSLDKLKQFIETHKTSEFAKPSSGFGRDIYEAGKKVGEDLVAYADDRVKKYQEDRAKNGKLLEKAEAVIVTGRELLPLLESFKAPDDTPLDSISKGFDQTEANAKRERNRTEALAKATKQLEKITDETIQVVESELTAAGFVGEPEAQSMLAAARTRLREMVKFEPLEAAPLVAPKSAAASILFVSPVGATRRPPITGTTDTAPPSVFLAVARGILYALEEDSGALLWALRVGPEITEPPAVARVDLEEGPTDLAIVSSSAGGEPAVAAYVLKTGAERWYQRLPAPAAGPAAIIGTRAYVATRDREGSIYVFDLTTGTRKGRICLQQTIGPGAVVRPGTGLLYVPADARRVFVFQAGAKDDDGTLRPIHCVQVLATGHQAGTLRTPPTLLGPDGDSPGDRWMVLTQADGPMSTKIRAFPVGPVPTATESGAPSDTPAAHSVELPVPGWVWFPPTTDGERLALATDSGQFRLFGVKQPNNLDRALFALPTPTLPPTPQGSANPSLIFPAEEAAFWVLANEEVDKSPRYGMLQKYRLALNPSRGLQVIRVGKPVDVGIPTQPPQLNNRKNAACLVVRSQNSAGSRAVLFNLADGEIRWQRQLGVIPAAPPLEQDGSLVLVAEDGGVVGIPGADAAKPGTTTPAPPAWAITDSPENATGPTVVAASTDGKVIFTVTPILAVENQKPLAKWLVRRISGGQLTHRGSAPAPSGIGGQPIVLGGLLLIPAADGTVYRHTPGNGKSTVDTLVAGPSWATDRRPADAVGYLTAISDSTFLTNDGTRKFAAWNWPKVGNWSPVGKDWELGERPAGPGIVLPPATPGDSPRLLVADVTGSVWLFAADRPGQHVRRWRPGGGLPGGSPTSPFVVQPDAANRLVVTYTVENKFLVCLDPERDLPRWAKPVSGETDSTLVGSPQAAGAGRWLVSDLGGHVILFDAEGEKQATLQIGLPGVVPVVAASSIGGAGVFAPLSDGSAVMLPLPKAPMSSPAPKGKSEDKE